MDSGQTTMIMIAVGAAITVAYRLGCRNRELAPEVKATLTALQEGQQDLRRGQWELKRGQAELNKRLDARTAELALIGEGLMTGQRTQLEAVASAWGALAMKPTGTLHHIRQARSPRA